MAYKAVFLDRDDTIIDDPGYLADPQGLTILPGVPLAIKSLRQAGYKIIVVTNQSGVARGLVTEETLERIHARLRQLLADKGAMIDAIYYCPFHPDGSVEKYRRESELRKPEPGMLIKAADQLNIDLQSSWMIGDSWRDIAAGKKAGCRAVQIIHSEEKSENPQAADYPPNHTAKNLVEAARIIMHAGDSVPAAQPEIPQPQEQEDAQAPQADYEDDTKYQPAEVAEMPAEVEVDCDCDDCEEIVEEVQEDIPQAVSEPIKPAFSLNRPETPADEELPADHDSMVRREILQHVRQMSKQGQHEEFSLISLLGGLCQILTLLFLFMTFWTGFYKDLQLKAVLWGVIAVVTQTMSLTFFTMSKKNR